MYKKGLEISVANSSFIYLIKVKKVIRAFVKAATKL